MDSPSLATTATCVGGHETRRIVGERVLTTEDALAGRRSALAGGHARETDLRYKGRVVHDSVIFVK